MYRLHLTYHHQRFGNLRLFHHGSNKFPHMHAFYSKHSHGREIIFSSGVCMGVCLSIVTIPQKIKFEWKLDGKEAKFERKKFSGKGSGMRN